MQHFAVRHGRTRRVRPIDAEADETRANRKFFNWIGQRRDGVSTEEGGRAYWK